MKISHFLAKICHFDGHFEFSNFRGMIKRHRRSNILTDSCSTPNLAMKTTCFIPDLQKKIQICPTLAITIQVHKPVAQGHNQRGV